MLTDHRRLQIIVTMLPPIKNDKTQKQDLFKSLELRLRLLSNQDDLDLYNMYKSYSKIIDNLTMILETLSIGHNLGTRESLNTIKNALAATSNKIEGDNLLARSLIKRSTLGKTIGQVTREERHKLGAELDDQPGKYALCDVEYVTQILVPTISQILSSTIANLRKDEEAAKPKLKGFRKQKAKPKKKNPKRVVQAKDEAWRLKDVACDSSTPSSSPQKEITENTTERPNEIASQPSTVLEVQDADDHILGIARGAPLTFGVLDLSTVESDDQQQDEDILSEKPWLAYNDKNSVAAKPDLVQAIPTFILNEEYSQTARTLLGLADNARDKLEMSAFVKLITDGLNGIVLNRKKCVHFMARSIHDHQWHSIAMHRLHQDDPTIIPRNTPYWSAAKRLLSDLDITGRNLK